MSGVRIPGGRKPTGDQTALSLFLTQLQSYVENLPILGDIVEIISGREDGDPTDIGSMINKAKNVIFGFFGFRAAISSRVSAIEGKIATGAEFYDNFNRGENTGALGNGWVQGGDGQPLGIRDQAAMVIVGGITAQAGRRWAKSPQAASGDAFTVSMVVYPNSAPSQYAETWLFARMNSAFTEGLVVRMTSTKCYLSRVSRSSGTSNTWTTIDVASNLTKSYSKSAIVEFRGEETVLQVSIDSAIVLTATDTVHTIDAAHRENGFAVQTTTLPGGFSPSYSGALDSYSLKSVVALQSVVTTATAVATETVAPVAVQAAAAQTSAQAATTKVSVVATQVIAVQQIIAVQSGNGLWLSGPDPTGTPSFPFALLNLKAHTGSVTINSGGTHTHGVTGSTASTTPSGGSSHLHAAGTLAASTTGSGHTHTGTVTIDNETVMTVNATASYAPWASVRFGSAAERKVITFLAGKTGTVSTFIIDVYRLNADGSSTLVWTSPDQAGNVAAGGMGWIQFAMSGASITADMGDTYEAQFSITGTGTVAIAAINMPQYAPLPGFRPYTFGSGRNPSTVRSPATISTTDRDAMYTGPVGFMTFGIDVGQTTLPRVFADDFDRTTGFGSRWITYGTIGISGGKVIYTGGTFDNATTAAMYTQPLISDTVRTEFDVSASGEAVGVGICATSGFGTAAWAVIRSGSALIQTGGVAEGARTTRATGTQFGDGHYILTYALSDNTFRLFKGDDTNQIASWVDTGNVIAHGDGRRWVGILARRNGLVNPSGQLDNFLAADVA